MILTSNKLIYYFCKEAGEAIPYSGDRRPA
jgi:hypothetical protein